MSLKRLFTRPLNGNPKTGLYQTQYFGEDCKKSLDISCLVRTVADERRVPARCAAGLIKGS